MFRVFGQFSRFAAVGAVATALHVAVALFFNGMLMLHPLLANGFGFLTAFLWSLVANWTWTFERSGKLARVAPRFLLISLVCFLVSEVTVLLLTSALQWPMWAALIPVVALVPPVNFWISKSHAFR